MPSPLPQNSLQPTKGPFAVSVSLGTPRRVSVYSQASGQTICEVSAEPEQDANAVLLAASSRLLSELVKMTDAYAKAMKDAGVSYYPEALHEVRSARAAIAAANCSANFPTSHVVGKT